ncbi:EndoU domain-containing protein [Streptomyces cirratus]
MTPSARTQDSLRGRVLIKAGTHTPPIKMGPGVEEFPPLPKGGRIPEHTFEHVLQGELKYDRNGNPKVSGYHFRPGGRDLNSHMVKVPKIIEIDNKTGLTTGNVWMRDPRTGLMVMKRAKTTFFPAGWTEKQVRRAMEKAFENGRVVNPITNKWQGDWKGIKFEGYFDRSRGTRRPFTRSCRISHEGEQISDSHSVLR